METLQLKPNKNKKTKKQETKESKTNSSVVIKQQKGDMIFACSPKKYRDFG